MGGVFPHRAWTQRFDWLYVLFLHVYSLRNGFHVFHLSVSVLLPLMYNVSLVIIGLWLPGLGFLWFPLVVSICLSETCNILLAFIGCGLAVVGFLRFPIIHIF